METFQCFQFISTYRALLAGHRAGSWIHVHQCDVALAHKELTGQSANRKTSVVTKWLGKSTDFSALAIPFGQLLEVLTSFESLN